MIKIAFFGTPELTETILDSLEKNDLLPTLVVTRPDMPKGRKLLLTPPPAKLWANRYGVECLQPEKLDNNFVEAMVARDFDIFLVVAYGKILPERLIDIPKYGTLNVHYSLLPKYRGATPVESAILSGDTETGVCIQKMRFALDTGPIVAEEKCPVPSSVTAPDLRDILNKKAADMLPDVLRKCVSGEITPVPQEEKEASYSAKIKKEDGLIDVHGDPLENDRKFRAYFDWPRTYFFAVSKKDGANKSRVIVSDARYENGKFEIKKVVPEGKKEISFEIFKQNYDF